MSDASPDLDTYFAARRRGNWFILLALLVFIGFTVGVTIWKWDTQEFLDITREHEANQQRLEAQRNLQESLNERLDDLDDGEPSDTPAQ